MEKVRAWCGQPADRGRLKNRTQHPQPGSISATAHGFPDGAGVQGGQGPVNGLVHLRRLGITKCQWVSRLRTEYNVIQ